MTLIWRVERSTSMKPGLRAPDLAAAVKEAATVVGVMVAGVVDDAIAGESHHPVSFSYNKSFQTLTGPGVMVVDIPVAAMMVRLQRYHGLMWRIRN